MPSAASYRPGFDGLIASVGGGLRYWADGPESGPEGLAVRFFVTLLFPK
jgi:hypothetical protein